MANRELQSAGSTSPSDRPTDQNHQPTGQHPIIAALLQLACMLIGGGLAWYDLRVEGSDVPISVYAFLLAVLVSVNERLFSKFNPWSK